MACGNPGSAKCAGTRAVSAAGRSYGLIRIFFPSLFGQSLCSSAPSGTHRGPLPGVLLCLECQPHRGPPWLGSYSVVQCVKHLMGHPLLFSCQCWHVEREKLWRWLYPLRVTQQCHLASMSTWLSSTGVSHHSLPAYIPSIHLSAVNSSPRPVIAP